VRDCVQVSDLRIGSSINEFKTLQSLAESDFAPYSIEKKRFPQDVATKINADTVLGQAGITATNNGSVLSINGVAALFFQFFDAGCSR
jgi:hypothetical protein